MTDKNKIRLSTEEIIVVAGMLGYKTVVGIENEITDKWKSSLHHRIRTIVKRLEKKRVIRFGLEGKLLIVNKVRLVVECLCDPEMFMILADTSQRSSDSKIYIMLKNGKYFRLSRTANGCCNVRITDELELNLFENHFDESDDIVDVSYPIETINKAKNAVDGFDEELARSLLSDNAECSENTDKIIELLENGYISINAFLKDGTIFRKFFNCNIGFCNKAAVEIKNDDDNIVHFRTIDPSFIETKLPDILRERGVLK